MSTLLNPSGTASYDPSSDRVVIVFRDGRDASVVELDPGIAPPLINSLMQAVHEAKVSRKPARPQPSPVPAPSRLAHTAPERLTFSLNLPRAAEPDQVPIRLRKH